MQDLINSTRKRFSFAWSKFAKREVSRHWYKDSFSYLQSIPEEIFKGKNKIGLDLGCGSGSDMIYIGQQHGPRIIGIDISDAIKTTYENIRQFDSLNVVQANIYNLPFKDETFDFAYSFGVLHHLPEPEAGFQALCSKIKKGGSAIVYVYEDFSERTLLERSLLKIVNLMRVITPKMPPFLLYIFCILSSPFVLIFCCIPHAILKRIPVTKGIAFMIPFRHTMRLDCIIADLYDRFSAPVEKRYNRKQVMGWFRRVNFGDIKVMYYRGWVAWGNKQS